MTALFAELRTPLLRYIRHLGLTPADGEDLVQEAFLSLFQHLRNDKAHDNPRGWLFRVVHNLALRRRAQAGRTVSTAPSQLEGMLAADGAFHPEEDAACAGEKRRLLAVVQALPERDRACLLLRAEGLRYREIAEALEISLGGVAASLSRSLGKLAKVYQR